MHLLFHYLCNPTVKYSVCFTGELVDSGVLYEWTISMPGSGSPQEISTGQLPVITLPNISPDQAIDVSVKARNQGKLCHQFSNSLFCIKSILCTKYVCTLLFICLTSDLNILQWTPELDSLLCLPLLSHSHWVTPQWLNPARSYNCQYR